TIPKTTLDPNVEQDKRIFGNTKEWTIYEVEPFPIKQITPIYPEFAKRSGIEGEVFLKVEVFEDGSVGAIRVLKSLMSGPGGLDEAAIKAVRQWEFEPAKSGGQPIAVWVTFSVTFSLE
ncbi:MAG: energy transducer TonB, partial [Candidatus Cloacimonetes bacterium]|nr:energy transducer TonB [Candidatus Cloacimonadota bacterium]